MRQRDNKPVPDTSGQVGPPGAGVRTHALPRFPNPATLTFNYFALRIDGKGSITKQEAYQAAAYAQEHRLLAAGRLLLGVPFGVVVWIAVTVWLAIDGPMWAVMILTNFVLVLWLFALLYSIATRKWVTAPALAHAAGVPVCPACWYRIEGLARCPECGSAPSEADATDRG